ncbi:MAG: PstS family phosphate ABC transporter substrate-binding protein [Patescibacteria group bacterium]
MKNIFITVAIVILVIIGAVLLIGRSSQKPETEKQSLTIKGSDTEVQLVSNLVEAFLEKNPKANISVTGGGSGVGIAALINSEIDMANSSREMKQDEKSQAASRGLDVQEFILARDGLSIIVHTENPIARLSLEQLGKIYKGEIKNWKEVGAKDAPIVLYGRQNTSGTYTFFRDFIVKADYSPEMRSMEGNQAIVDAVKADKNGLGYVGVGYVKNEKSEPRQDIKVILVSGKEGSPISPLDKEAVKNGQYPIVRPIFQYTAHLPQKGSLQEQFLRFEASAEGQAIIEQAGFYSITNEDQQKNNQLFEKIR